MAENDPRQIDVNLSIGDKSELTAFIQEMKALRETMAKQQGEGGLPTGHQQVSSGPSAGASRAAYQPMASPQDLMASPQQAAQNWSSLGQPSRGPMWRALSGSGFSPDVTGSSSREDMELGQGGGASRPGAGGPGGGSSGIDPKASWWQNRIQGSLNDPIQMPRFGEFTAQDTLNMLANVTGRGSQMGALQGSGGPSIAANALGGASGLLNIAQGYSPYIARAQQALGVNFAPQALQSQGQSLGLRRTSGADVNLPFGLGGFQIPGSQFFGQAGGTMAQQNIRSLGAGIQPGISVMESQEFQDALNELGWTNQDVVGNLSDTYTKLKSDMGQTLPSASVTASMMDQSIRYGNTPFSDLEDTFRNMDQAAQAANMKLDEFAQGLDQAGNYLQGKGLSYNQGVQAATNISSLTDMPPEIVQQVMDAPLWQSTALGRYGVLPEAQGAIAQNPQAFMGTTMRTINQMMGAYKGAFQNVNVPVKLGGQVVGQDQISSRMQAMSMVAPQLGMTPDQMNDFMRRGKQMQQQSTVSSLTQLYGRDVERFGAGKIPSDSASAVTWTELKKSLEQKQSGFGPDFINRLQGMNPSDRVNAIQDKIKSFRHTQDPNRVSLDLTPRAAQLVRELKHPSRHDENQGNSPRNEGSGSAGKLFGMNLPDVSIPTPSISDIHW
jgi:hypothetical protein